MKGRKKEYVLSSILSFLLFFFPPPFFFNSTASLFLFRYSGDYSVHCTYKASFETIHAMGSVTQRHVESSPFFFSRSRDSKVIVTRCAEFAAPWQKLVEKNHCGGLSVLDTRLPNSQNDITVHQEWSMQERRINRGCCSRSSAINSTPPPPESRNREIFLPMIPMIITSPTDRSLLPRLVPGTSLLR